jgi:hypothetical protein
VKLKEQVINTDENNKRKRLSDEVSSTSEVISEIADLEIVITDNHPEEHDNFSYIFEENKMVDGKILIDCSIWPSSSHIDLMLIDQYSMRRSHNRFVTKDLLYMMFGYEQLDKQITGKSYKTFEIFLN